MDFQSSGNFLSATKADITPGGRERDSKSHEDIQQGCNGYNKKRGVSQLRENQEFDQADDEYAQGECVINNDMVRCFGCLESLYIQGQKTDKNQQVTNCDNQCAC